MTELSTRALLESGLAVMRDEVREWDQAGRPHGDHSRWPVRLTAPEAEALLAEYDRRGRKEIEVTK